LLEEKYYAASCLHWKCLCTGEKFSERVLRPATGYELQSGEGEQKIWTDSEVIFRTFQLR